MRLKCTRLGFVGYRQGLVKNNTYVTLYHRPDGSPQYPSLLPSWPISLLERAYRVVVTSSSSELLGGRRPSVLSAK
jgi:hypothetical protein